MPCCFFHGSYHGFHTLVADSVNFFNVVIQRAVQNHGCVLDFPMLFEIAMAHTAILADFVVSVGQFNVRDKIISDLLLCAAQFFV